MHWHRRMVVDGSPYPSRQFGCLCPVCEVLSGILCKYDGSLTKEEHVMWLQLPHRSNL